MAVLHKPTMIKLINGLIGKTAAALLALLSADGELNDAELQQVISVAILEGALIGGRYQLSLLSRRPPNYSNGALAVVTLTAQAVTAATRARTQWQEQRLEAKPYSRLVADYNTRYGFQYGVSDAAARIQSGEIPLKQGAQKGELLEPVWVRMFPRSEPRNNHDALNGTAPKSNGKWSLDTPQGVIEVSRPFDPAAPWSNWANCGHAVQYRRVA